MIKANHAEIFRTFSAFLKENKITHFLIAGSLLGAYRDRGTIQWDEDIDIGIYSEDFEKLKQLINTHTLEWDIYNQWRKEITILRRGYAKCDSQIDVFSIDRDEEFAYIYSNKSNPFSKVWDIEWRMKFPRKYFDNLIPYTAFLPNLTIKIPKYAEEVLALEYGENWRKPNSKWNTYDAPAYDHEYREISIIIPTFLRDDCMKKLVESIEQTLPDEWYRLYIADQGFYTKEKQDFYNNLIKKGHKCYYIPFNSGLSRARNFLINKSKEPFSLIVDDDFEFNDTTKLHNFVDILNTKSDIGVVGGTLIGHTDYNYNLVFYNGKLFYIQTKPKEYFQSTSSLVKKSVPFIYCDIVLNFALFKRELFNDISWDDKLKLAEHTDFYLQLKKLNKWKVTFTSTVSTNHQAHENSQEYINFRKNVNPNEGLSIVFDKWKINESSIIYVREE